MHSGGYVESRLEDAKKYNELAELADVLLRELARLQQSRGYKPSKAVEHCMEKTHSILTGGF